MFEQGQIVRLVKPASRRESQATFKVREVRQQCGSVVVQGETGLRFFKPEALVEVGTRKLKDKTARATWANGVGGVKPSRRKR